MEKKLLVMSGLLSMTVIGVLAGVQEGSRAAATASMGTTVPFVELAQGVQSGVTLRINYLLTSEGQFADLWKTIYGTSTPPAIDFATQSVVAVFAGQMPTTGYLIKVAGITDSDARYVSVMLTKPGTDCIEGQIITTPYEIVAVPATTLALTHEDTTLTKSCSH